MNANTINGHIISSKVGQQQLQYKSDGMNGRLNEENFLKKSMNLVENEWKSI